jgi:hypothetical protein
MADISSPTRPGGAASAVLETHRQNPRCESKILQNAAFTKHLSLGHVVVPPRDNSRMVGKQEVIRLLPDRPSALASHVTNRPGVRSGHISGFDVPEISVVGGVDFNRAE